MNSPTRTNTSREPLGDIMARLGRAQKSNRGAAAYSRWVNRPVGRYIAALAYQRGLTPNQVTVISAALTFTALALIALVRPTPGSGLLIALLLMAGYAFDAADGQLARLRGGGSAAGEWLDHVVDGTKIAIIHLAVLISWYRWYELADERLLLIPMLFAVQASVFFFALILTEQLRRSAARSTPASLPTSSEPAPYLRSFVVLPGDYGLLCVVFALIGFPRVFVVLYGTLAAINILFLLAGAVRWYREMRALS